MIEVCQGVKAIEPPKSKEIPVKTVRVPSKTAKAA